MPLFYRKFKYCFSGSDIFLKITSSVRNELEMTFLYILTRNNIIVANRRLNTS